MACSTPRTARWSHVFFVAAASAALVPGLAAQQATGLSTPPRHPVVIVQGVRQTPAPGAPPGHAAITLPVAQAGVMPRPARPIGLGRFASILGVDPVGGFAEEEFFRAVFEAPGFIAPFFLSAPFPGEFGLPGAVAGELPLGFGLWPACNPASISGMFWTVGPCFGTAYSAASIAGAAQPSPYVPWLIIVSQPATGPATAQLPNVPSPPPTMILYFTDGRSVTATDWWVVHGRLHYVTNSGEEVTADLSQLDLEQTIKENQKRGLEFHLKFVAPSDRYRP